MLGGYEAKMETDRFGKTVTHPFAEFVHGLRQGEIAFQLRALLPAGKATVECPISTSEGIKVADVVWLSRRRLKQVGGRAALSGAPEICVEVLSGSNTREEMEERRRLYFEAGAQEVWLCGRNGALRFFKATAPTIAAKASKLCPPMPKRLK